MSVAPLASSSAVICLLNGYWRLPLGLVAKVKKTKAHELHFCLLMDDVSLHLSHSLDHEEIKSDLLVTLHMIFFSFSISDPHSSLFFRSF